MSNALTVIEEHNIILSISSWANNFVVLANDSANLAHLRIHAYGIDINEDNLFLSILSIAWAVSYPRTDKYSNMGHLSWRNSVCLKWISEKLVYISQQSKGRLGKMSWIITCSRKGAGYVFLISTWSLSRNNATLNEIYNGCIVIEKIV